MLSKCRVFIELWEATQVELHGQYSAQRVLALAEYEQGTHLARSVLVMLVTPLPCLVITILIDILPLSDPSEGIENNNAFMVRQYYNYLLVTFIAIQQIRIGVPSLPYNNGHVLRDTIVVATLTLGIYYAVTLSVGFPLPFTILVMMSPWSVLISLCLAIQRARVIRDTPGARAMLSSMFKLWMYEILMVFIYPPYFYVFTTLSDKAQVGFSLLLPIIKVLMRKPLRKGRCPSRRRNPRARDFQRRRLQLSIRVVLHAELPVVSYDHGANAR